MSDMMRPSEEERRFAALVGEHTRHGQARCVTIGLSKADKDAIRRIVREEIEKALREQRTKK